MNKAFIFDLDDTLLYSAHIKWEQHRVVARKIYGIHLDNSILSRHWGKPSIELVKIFYQDAEDAPAMLERFHSYDDQFLKTPIPGAFNILFRLIDEGHMVGVVTNARKESVDKDARRLKLPLDKLHFVHTYEDTGKYKPDPASFDLAWTELHKNNIKDVTYVGDSVNDYRAATNARLKFIGITTGPTTQEELEAAGVQVVIYNLNELLFKGVA